MYLIFAFGIISIRSVFFLLRQSHREKYHENEKIEFPVGRSESRKSF